MDGRGHESWADCRVSPCAFVCLVVYVENVGRDTTSVGHLPVHVPIPGRLVLLGSYRRVGVLPYWRWFSRLPPGHHGGQSHERGPLRSIDAALFTVSIHGRRSNILDTNERPNSSGRPTKPNITDKASGNTARDLSWLHATHHRSDRGRPAGTLRTFGHGNEHRLHRMPSTVDAQGGRPIRQDPGNLVCRVSLHSASTHRRWVPGNLLWLLRRACLASWQNCFQARRIP
jgi:hypothetical protein